MKNRLNITISDDLLLQAKKYALKHNTSLSQLIEDYFIRITRPAKRKTVIDVIKGLPKPRAEKLGDVREKYYTEQKKKYGF